MFNVSTCLTDYVLEKRKQEEEKRKEGNLKVFVLFVE